MRYKPITIGDRFGRLVVTSADERVYVAPSTGQQRRRWIVLCDCGSSARSVIEDALKSGHTRSCGCGVRDASAARTRHGHARTNNNSPEYVAWQNMKARCNNPKNQRYPDYGGRGIVVCAEWAGPDGFVAFFAAMGPRPTAEHSIDRLDNDGPYSPENCRWAVEREQMRNRRDNVMLTAFGRTMCMQDWAVMYGIHPETLRRRIRSGWPPERAVTTAVRVQRAH